jgi:acyl carrier protein
MASYEETLKATSEIIAKHVELERPIKPEDHIQNDLGLDSLGVMEVVADIEDRFEIQIPTETLTRFATVDDVAKALSELSRERS